MCFVRTLVEIHLNISFWWWTLANRTNCCMKFIYVAQSWTYRCVDITTKLWKYPQCLPYIKIDVNQKRSSTHFIIFQGFERHSTHPLWICKVKNGNQIPCHTEFEWWFFVKYKCWQRIKSNANVGLHTAIQPLLNYGISSAKGKFFKWVCQKCIVLLSAVVNI